MNYYVNGSKSFRYLDKRSSTKMLDINGKDKELFKLAKKSTSRINVQNSNKSSRMNLNKLGFGGVIHEVTNGPSGPLSTTENSSIKTPLIQSPKFTRNKYNNKIPQNKLGNTLLSFSSEKSGRDDELPPSKNFDLISDIELKALYDNTQANIKRNKVIIVIY